MKKLTSVIAIMLIAILALGVFTSCEPAETPAEKIYFAKNGASEYSVVYSNDGVIHESAASRLYQAFALEMLIPAEMYEDSAKSNAKEILFGKTDRALSVELAAAVDAAVAGDNKYAYGYGYKDGKLAFYATDAKAIEYSLVEFLKVLRTEDEALCCMSDLWVVKGISDADYDAYLEAKIPYYITYATDGGIITSEAPLTYNYGTGVDLPTKVTKPGYEFVGWYSNPDFRGKAITSISKEYKADLTVYAKWNKVAAFITYELNGGTYEGSEELVTLKPDGTSITLPTEVSRLFGKFVGWWDNAKFEGEPITEIPAAGIDDVTVYAKYDGLTLINTKVTNGTQMSPGTIAMETLHIMTNPDKAISLRFLLDAVDAAKVTNSATMRVRTANNTHAVYPISVANGVFKAVDGTVLASNSAEKQIVIDMVMDFDDKTITYYVDEVEVLKVENIGFADLGTGAYNNTGTYHFWQWNGTTNAHTVYTVSGNVATLYETAE